MTTTQPVERIAERNLRVLIADENEPALRRLHGVLSQLGHDVTPHAVSVSAAAELIAREDPDLAIVVVHNDDQHALALIAEAIEYASGPVIALVPDADVAFLARAAELGISAYAESMEPESVQAAIEVAVRRYRETNRLNEKVEQLESALERRGMIERAKGILMERHDVDERKAFELMREQARRSGRRVVDVAQVVLDGHPLLPKRG
jgi:AmiR/NasT family two-component response regulator